MNHLIGLFHLETDVPRVFFVDKYAAEVISTRLYLSRALVNVVFESVVLL